MRNRFARLAAWAVERPTQVVVATVLLTLIGVIAALRLAPEASVGLSGEDFGRSGVKLNGKLIRRA